MTIGPQTIAEQIKNVDRTPIPPETIEPAAQLIARKLPKTLIKAEIEDDFAHMGIGLQIRNTLRENPKIPPLTDIQLDDHWRIIARRARQIAILNRKP
jgi:hypothetical protein